MAAKNHRRAHANLANQQDRLRAGIGRRGWRICIKAERRHNDGIYGFLSKRWRGRRVWFLAVGLHRTPEGSDFPRNWRTRTLPACPRKTPEAKGVLPLKHFHPSTP